MITLLACKLSLATMQCTPVPVLFHRHFETMMGCQAYLEDTLGAVEGVVVSEGQSFYFVCAPRT